MYWSPESVTRAVSRPSALEARVDAAQRREALEHQARADQQDDGEGDLRDDESLAQDPRPHAGASGTGAVLEGVLDVGARAGERRSETAEPRRQHRDQEREGQDLRAQAKQGEAGQIRRTQRDEKGDAPSRQQEAHGAPHEGQEQVLRQQLGEDPPAARAERRADGHLPHAGGAPREEQARHVRAGDEEHEAHGAEKDQEGRAHLARDLGVQGNDPDAPARVAIRELGGEGRSDRRHFRLRRRGRLARLQPGDRRGVAAALLRAFLGEHHGRPEVRGLSGERSRLQEEAETRRHDADDRDGTAVDLDGPPDDGRIAAEAALPEAVAEDHDLIVPVGTFVGREGAAEHRRDAEGREEARHDELRDELLRPAVAGEVDPVVVETGHRRERRFPLLPPAVVERGDDVLAAGTLRALFPDRHETGRLLEGQTLDEHGVDDREDRRVRADAQGESRDRDGGEAGVFAERAGREAEVLPGPLEEGQAAAIAHGLLRDVESAELAGPLARRASSGAIPPRTASSTCIWM